MKAWLPLAEAGGIAVAACADSSTPIRPADPKARESLEQQQIQGPPLPLSPLVIVTISGSIPASGPDGTDKLRCVPIARPATRCSAEATQSPATEQDLPTRSSPTPQATDHGPCRRTAPSVGVH